MVQTEIVEDKDLPSTKTTLMVQAMERKVSSADSAAMARKTTLVKTQVPGTETSAPLV